MTRPPENPPAGTRGLTLTEMLLVVAILGLLFAVLLVYMFPSDDRRVRLEAERMAAYLLAASAEAKMSDGPVRVAFDLEQQKYDREKSKMGARIADVPWEDDPRADTEAVRAPVRLTTVIMPDAGEVQAQTAWIVWRSTSTAGGVGVLALNEAVYSVVVDPNSGEVRVERGRAQIPTRVGGLRRALRLDHPEPLAMGEGEVLTDIPPPPPPPPPPSEPEPPPPPGADAGAPPPPDEPPPDEPPVEEPPIEEPPIEEPPIEEPPPEEPPPVPDAAPPPEEPECDPVSKPCVEPGTVCVEGKCVGDPRGRAVRARRLTVNAPSHPLLTAALEEKLNDAIASKGFDLIVSVPMQELGQVMFAHVLDGELSQGMAAGPRGLPAYGPSLATPSFRALMTREESCPGEDVLFCGRLRPSSATVSATGDPVIHLFVLQPARAGRAPCFVKISVIANLQLTMRSGPLFTFELFGAISERDARLTRVDLGGSFGDRTLKELFENAGIPPDVPTTSDGVNNGWRVHFSAQTTEIDLVGDPGYAENMQPENQCQ